MRTVPRGPGPGKRRVSGLRLTVSRLRRQALSAPQQAFQEGLLRQPALAGHPSVPAVLAAFDDERDETYPSRDALTRALLAQYQASTNSLWASLLLVAYYPMLSRLRLRLNDNPFPVDELDQVVVLAFLTTLAEFPLAEVTDRVPMRIRQGTQRQVFDRLRKERALLPMAMPEEDDDELEDSSRPPRPQQPLLSSEEEEMIDLSLLLRRAARTGFSWGGLEVVSATVLKREPLADYVDRLCPEDALEHGRLYERLKRRRSRTMRHLRTLADLSPLAQVEGS